MDIKQLEQMLRQSSLAEGKIRRQEIITGVPRPEMEKDKAYKAEIKSKNELYKKGLWSVDFVKAEPKQLKNI